MTEEDEGSWDYCIGALLLQQRGSESGRAVSGPRADHAVVVAADHNDRSLRVC